MKQNVFESILAVIGTWQSLSADLTDVVTIVSLSVYYSGAMEQSS